MAHYLSYEDRRDMITTHAWEIWTENGLNMDEDMRFQTEKPVGDAVTNTYVDNITDTDWLAATLKRLSHEPPNALPEVSRASHYS